MLRATQAAYVVVEIQFDNFACEYLTMLSKDINQTRARPQLFMRTHINKLALAVVECYIWCVDWAQNHQV